MEPTLFALPSIAVVSGYVVVLSICSLGYPESSGISSSCTSPGAAMPSLVVAALGGWPMSSQGLWPWVWVLAAMGTNNVMGHVNVLLIVLWLVPWHNDGVSEVPTNLALLMALLGVLSHIFLQLQDMLWKSCSIEEDKRPL